MDVLSFRIEGTPIEYGTDLHGERMPYGGEAQLEILVNGEPLRSIVGRAEKRDATADGQAILAGAYAHLTGHRFPHGLFFGRPTDVWDDDLRHGERVAVMGCDCGIVGCWPFLVRIEVGPAEVLWGDFQQPHRRWRYDALGTFRFDREEYERAVHDAATAFAATVQYTDEMASRFARSLRGHLTGCANDLRGLLIALGRRDELPRRTDKQRDELIRDGAQFLAAVRETADILALSEGQAFTIVPRDLDQMSEPALRDLLAEVERVAALSDAELREAYRPCVDSLRRMGV